MCGYSQIGIRCRDGLARHTRRDVAVKEVETVRRHPCIRPEKTNTQGIAADEVLDAIITQGGGCSEGEEYREE